MSEETPVKSYYVQLPGYDKGEVWDEAKYNRNKENLFNDHKDAMVVETTALSPEEDIAGEGMYTVHLPGFQKAELWDSDKLSRNRDALLRDHPDVEISRTTPVNYWGDRLKDNYDRVEALREELKGLPEPSVDMNISDADALAAVQDTPERRRRAEINRDIDQLLRDRENNPAYKAYWDDQKKSLASDAQRSKDEAKRIRKEDGRNLETDYYNLANRFYNDALKTANAPSKYDDSKTGFGNFVRGVGQNMMSAVSLLEFAKSLDSLNLVDTVRQVQKAKGDEADLSDLINNHPEELDFLTNGQREMLKAFVRKAEVESGRADNMSVGYNAGRGAIQSAGFMADFLLTGGVGDAAASAATRKLGLQASKDIVAKGLGQQAKKLAIGNLEGAVKALAMTPMMPSSYSNFINNLTTLNEDGQMDLGAKAVLNSVGDVLIENFSENAGELFGIPFEGKLFDAISKSQLGNIGRALGRTNTGTILRQAGFHGLVGEMAEEVLGNAMRSVTGIDKDALSNFFQKDEFLTTLASFAPMTVLGGIGSTASAVKTYRKASKAGSELEKILSGLGMDEEKIRELMDLSEADSPQQIGSYVSEIGREAIATGKVTRENFRELGTALGNYTIAKSNLKVLKGVLAEEDDVRRAQDSAVIDGQTGTNRWWHRGEDGNGYVRTITDADGNESFVISEMDGELALVDRNGQRTFMSAESLANGIESGALTDSGEKAINEYLDNIEDTRAQMAEAERMNQERAEQVSSIRSRLEADPHINMGTDESPVNATVTGLDQGGVVVEWDNEEGHQMQRMSWDEAGQYLGTPVEVKTDDQIEQEEAEAEEEIAARRSDYNNYIPKDESFTAVLVEGEAPVEYKFKRATVNEDGMLILQVLNTETNEEELIPEEAGLRGNLTTVLDSFKNPAQTEAEEDAEEKAEVDNTRRDFRGNLIPLKDDGTVNQAAFWRADPEAWARWNDGQRQDGGANSRGYIAKAVKQLQSEAKAIQKQIDKELDFDKIERLEGQLAEKNGKIADLTRIEANYAAAEAAAVAAQEAEEKRSVEDTKRAERNRERDLNEPKTLEEVVANWLSGVKKGSLNKEDFKRETGLGETELKRFFPWWAKKGQGMSVIELAESIAADDDSGLIPRDSNADQPDIQAVRDAIINVITSSSRPGDVARLTREANLQREEAERAAYSEAPAEAQAEVQTEAQEETDMPSEIFTDRQGNPLNDDGTLAVTPVSSIDELTDEDFTKPSRTVALPALPANVDAAIGANGKPVIIKKNIFERNARKHTDLTPEQSRQIITDALYNPQLYGQNQKATKPYNWVVINTIGINGENRIVLLEIDSAKENVEIVHWHYIDARGIEKIKRQAEREDGQLLILPSVATEEVGALSDPTLGESSDNKDSKNSGDTSVSGENIKQETIRAEKTPHHPATLKEAYESGEAARIAEAERAIAGFINASEDIDAVNTTTNEAKARRKKAEKGSAEYKTQDFIAKAAAARLKQLREAGMKTFAERQSAAMETYWNLSGASEDQLRDALAYFESQSQYEADRGRADEVRKVLDERLESERQRPLRGRVREWEEKTGVSMEVIESRDQVTNKSAQKAIDTGQNPTGWYEPESGKVVIYLPNVKDVSEIDKTYMHEVVSHKGLRELLGEEGFNSLMDSVWNDLMSESDRSRWLAYNSHLKGSEEYLRRAAADEFVAHIAESLDANETNSTWDKIVETVKEILNKLGLDLRLTDDDLKSLLRSSLANYEKIQAERKAEAEKKVSESESGELTEAQKKAIAFVEGKTPEQVESKPGRKVTASKDRKIDDFGEKIGGARKDMAREKIKDSAKLTVKDLGELKDPDKILSRKQIAKYVAEGQMTSDDAQTLLAANMAARATSGLDSYKALMLVKYRDLASAWERGEDIALEMTQEDEDFILSQYSERIQQSPGIRESIRKSLSYHVKTFEDYRRTYEAIDYPNTMRDIKGAYISEGRVDGRFWVKGSYSANRGYPFATFDEAVVKLKSLYPEKVNVDKEAKKVKDSGDKKTGHLKIAKDEYGYYRVKSNLIPGQIYLSKKFYTKKDAEAYLDDNADALVDRETKMAYALMGSNIGMVQREGRDYRGGKDVTEKAFMETFSPRGVEFGNWVPQAERQEYLNKTYDAIMDFCQVVGISPKAFFLGGRLGIAFGARGHSGALAHYETLKEVINLTRMKGAGSLAHEWFHALDNYLAKRKTGNTSDMATDTRNVERQEVADAFTDFVKAMNALDYSRRSRRAGDYWYEVWERAARLFEDYTYNELGGKGIVSPLLSRAPEGKNMEIGEDFISSAWPYPTREENETMKPYFDRLFSVIQEEEGTGVLYRKGEGNLKQAQLDIINASNPMMDDYHTGIRSVDDIKTWDEAVAQARREAEQGGWDELSAYPDVSNTIVEKALESGRMTVYSSYPIENGVFVTPSRMQARDYAGGGEVYSKTVPTANVAWINTDEGQYAETEGDKEDILEGTRFRKANQTQNGFISNAEAALDRIKMDKATPEQWIKMLEKEGGLKAGEDKWLGLSDWLKDSDRKTLTKDEVGEFIAENRIQIEEEEYGELGLDELQAEFDEIYDGIIDGVGSENEDEDDLKLYQVVMSPMERAWDELSSRHGGGDDFDMAFSLDDNGRIEISDEDAAGFFLGKKPINSTRLDYTTEGLDNKREIALTVPTIEPWNENDSIHFGDAGEGRAVAWIRFGDATSVEGGEQEEARPQDEVLTPEQRERLDSLDDRVRNAGLTAQASTNQEELDVAEAALREAMAQRDTYKREIGLFDRPTRRARTGRRSKVLVIDEIQSKRHQEGRERGYKDEGIEKKANRRGELSRKSYSDEGLTFDEYKEFKALQEELYNIGEANVDKNRRAIPAAPFEKNWHELAMKRMLRLAAEEGYDKVAWTTGDQQAERYNIGKAVDDIEKRDGKIYIDLKDGSAITLTADRDGTITSSTGAHIQSGEYNGKNLSEIIGKELAGKVLSAEGNQVFRGFDLRVGGEGMRGFYDDILPRFMNKYGKKWGVKVGTVELEYVYDELGHPLVMHSIDVTPEMRESVMEGQVMFRKADDSKNPKRGLPIDEYYNVIDGLFGDSSFNKDEHIRERYDFGDTPSWMKDAGLKGDNFSFSFKVIRDHYGKDSDHSLTAEEWKALPEAVKSPFLVTKYQGNKDKFRLYTGITHNGKYVAVGVDVVKINQGKDTAIIEVNRIKTAFGVNGGISSSERVVTYDERITPEQEALLRGLNYREYPSIQELSRSKDSNYSDNSNNNPEDFASEYGDAEVRFRKVTDQSTLDRLNSEPTIKVYRAMQEIDGKLYPPMAAKVEGRMQEPIEIGVWEEAVERPELADAKGNFTLNKGNGKSLKARYNPYIHTSRSPLNDQFTSAYDRPNLVTVEVEVPESELTSGYKAEKAKDAVGEMTWHAGPVSGKLPEGKKRKVILSRWDRPVRIVPDSEVAERIAELLEGENITVPYNVVTPSLREALIEKGVEISGEPSGKVREDVGQIRFRKSQDLVKQSRESGMAGVIGEEDASELYRNIYRAVPSDIRQMIVDKAGDGYIFTDATRDMISEAVEKGDETGIAGLAANMLRNYVGDLDERTARYILWRGTRKVADDDLIDTVNDIAMQRRLQVGEFANPVMFRLSDDLEEAQNRANSMSDDAKATLDEKKEDARENDALTTVKAMSLQKEYDRKTVNTITVLAKNIIKDQNIDSLRKHEISRLLSFVTASVGKAPKTVKKNADALMGLVVDHLLRSEETKLGILTSRKASKVNAAGVEVQGELDVRGQNILKAYKAGLDMEIDNPNDETDENTINGRLAILSERLSGSDDALRSEAEDEYAGLMLAKEYLEDVKASVNEERGIRNEIRAAEEDLHAGKMSRKDFNEFIEEANNSIRENKVERIEAYRDLAAKMRDMMAGSIEARKAFTEREKARVEEIHHLANSDMQGRTASPFRESTRLGRLANSSIVRFFAKPLATFDQMLRLFGGKNVAGEGYLWNKFHRGWIEADENAYLGEREAKSELDAKVSEVFGKEMRWSDLYAEERKMPTVPVKWWDDGEMREHELTQGNLLYIYMVNKMTDGRMKLRRMGITQDIVDRIARQMDSRFIELADWLQSEYLVQKRNKYNAVHERLFGASMAAIEDYFPLKINKRSLNRAEDIGRPEFDDALPATTTGSIVKRKRNSQDLDLAGADAFSVVIEHIEQMEQWAAFAEFNKDLNTLLSYKRFRNQVQNMASVYGSGRELWNNFKSVCRIAGGTYNPAGKKSDLDTAALNIAKGVTAAKISFRVYTALKQFLSMPAFVSDANIKYLAGNIATPWKAWNWAMENLPMFEKRWMSRMAGDTRLMKTESDWKLWRNNIVEKLSRWGMSPNGFVDALTVSIGAHSIYQTRYDRYIKDGYSEEVADKKAKQDATTLYNETQQSNESAFVAPVQLDRTVLSTMLTVFRNSSMGYQRQLHDAIRNIGKMMRKGYKAESVEFMKRQMIRDGLTEEQAEHAANRNYNREIWRSAARVGTFGFLVQFAWNLGGSIAYLLFGDDDDKKEEMLKEAAIHGLIGGSMEGLAGGNVMSEALNMVAKGESLRNYDPSLLPIVSDLKSTYKKMSYDPVAGWNDLINLAIQASIGANPQTLTDAVVAVVDACGGDLDTSKEAMLLIMRVLQVPQSQVDQIYIDELDMTAGKARTMSPGQMAERYARYKVAKGAPLTGWAYSDEAEEKREKAYLKSFNKKVKERQELHKRK